MRTRRLKIRYSRILLQLIQSEINWIKNGKWQNVTIPKKSWTKVQDQKAEKCITKTLWLDVANVTTVE